MPSGQKTEWVYSTPVHLRTTRGRIKMVTNKLYKFINWQLLSISFLLKVRQRVLLQNLPTPHIYDYFLSTVATPGGHLFRWRQQWLLRRQQQTNWRGCNLINLTCYIQNKYLRTCAINKTNTFKQRRYLFCNFYDLRVELSERFYVALDILLIVLYSCLLLDWTAVP